MITLDALKNMFKKLQEAAPQKLSLEQEEAKQFLQDLIRPYVRENSPEVYSEEAQTNMSNALNQFFKIRKMVAPESKNTVVDDLFNDLKTKIKQSIETLEEKIIAGMLKEIFNNKKPASKSVFLPGGTQEMEPMQLSQYYTLACHPEKRLEKLYVHTQKNPRDSYVNNQPLIHSIIACGDMDFLKQIAAQHGALECLDNNETPLRYAAKIANASAVTVLLDAGANVNSSSKSGRTALTNAINQTTEQVETVDAILKGAGIDIYYQSALLGVRVDTALQLIVKHKHWQILSLLLNHPTAEKAKFLIGTQEISKWAISSKEAVVLELLIKKKWITSEDQFDEGSILHEAIVHNWLGVVDAILTLPGKDKFINVQQGEEGLGCTPLMLAVWRGRIDIVKKLIAAKADVNIALSNNNTAMDFACGQVLSNVLQPQYQKIVKIFLQHPDIGMTLNGKNGDKSPLSWSVSHKNSPIIALLVADIRVTMTESYEIELRAKASKNNWANVEEAFKVRNTLKPKPLLSDTQKQIELRLSDLENTVKMQGKTIEQQNKIIAMLMEKLQIELPASEVKQEVQKEVLSFSQWQNVNHNTATTVVDVSNANNQNDLSKKTTI